MPLSQLSPGSTTPFPQAAGQSLSVAALAPGGQHPSPAAACVMRVWVHVALQPLPASVSRVQTSLSVQLCGQAPG